MTGVTDSPRFITVEGGEGVGKSTQLACIERCLKARGIPLVVTREPGGTPLGERLRELLLEKEGLGPTPMAELLMVFAARAQHVATVIQPALARGEWVLCDRFSDASHAYQGQGRGIPAETIVALQELAHPGLEPHLTFLLDVEPRVGLDRARRRGDLDRFEQEALEFFEAVREGYRHRVQQAPQRWRVIDAGESLEQVERQITAAIEQWFNDDTH